MKSTPKPSTHRAALFDASTFHQQLISAPSALGYYKEQIDHARSLLNARFKKNEDIKAIIKDLSWFTDQILITVWQQFDWKDADDISLLAVGGYGRGELHPYSDIDIQILLKNDLHQQYKENIEKFLTFLWDINLEVGQSVRTIDENMQEAKGDITIATALMESRTVYGNQALHEEVMANVNQTHIWKPAQFFAAKVAEQERRHSRHNNIEYALEPNIKVAPGGLRDFQTIGWITKRYFDVSDFLALVEKGFLQKSEFNDLIRGRDFLWKIRYGLHMIAGKREDRLLFEHQRSLAKIFSFEDDKKSLGIEKLMKEYYLVVQILRELNDVILQLFDEEIIRSKEPVKIQPVNARFQIRNQYLEVIDFDIFQKSPSALIEIFVLFAQDIKIEGIRASTIRLLRNGPALIDDKFRANSKNNALFMEFLKSPHKMVTKLRQMKRYGILSAYLPEFGKIVGQMQHDLFHIYTVDDHTLQVIENMQRLRLADAGEKFPIAAQVIKQLPKLELLYIAGLYHDIAKGRGGDHSLLGVKDAKNFCQQHGLNEAETKLIGWLVKSHLTMSSIAQRDDLEDPEVIKRFAMLVGDQVHLDYLYVLTVADINATNPKLWNGWRASLLRRLYYATKRALSQGMEQIVGKTGIIIENKKNALAMLQTEGYSKEQVLALWKNPIEDYFLRETPGDITWHTIALAKNINTNKPIILIKNSTEHAYEGATQVFIYTQISNVLFANIATAFDRLNMDIQDARIFNTESNYCFITFMVLEADGSSAGTSFSRNEEIEKVVMENIKSKIDTNSTRNCSPSRKLKYFTRKTETTLTNNENTPYSILEVLCPDRQGLLAIVANIFVAMDIVLLNAKITTLGENVEDVFFITDSNNKPITDPQTMTEIQTTIKEQLDAEISD